MDCQPGPECVSSFSCRQLCSAEPEPSSVEIEPARRAVLLNQRWAATLLITGATFGLLALLLAIDFGLGPHMLTANTDCFLERACPSGNRYFPETVSELVSKPGDPTSVLFQSFAIIGSFSILISRYPLELRNVYTKQTARFSLAGVRTFVVPVGMMIVAWVQVIPRARRTLRDEFSADIHTFGAFCFIGVYLMVEVVSLCRLRKRLARREKRWRWAAVVSIAAFTVIFELPGGVLAKAEDLGICCADEWIGIAEAFKSEYVNVSSPIIDAELAIVQHEYGMKVLKDSSFGTFRIRKILEFWCETGAGVAVLLSHALIWAFSYERRIMIPAITPLPLEPPEEPLAVEVNGGC